MDRLRDSLGNFNIRSLVLRFDRWKAKARWNSSFRPFRLDYNRRSTWDDSIRSVNIEIRSLGNFNIRSLVLRFDRWKAKPIRNNRLSPFRLDLD
jgi:predicted HD phosphohydrolase